MLGFACGCSRRRIRAGTGVAALIGIAFLFPHSAGRAKAALPSAGAGRSASVDAVDKQRFRKHRRFRHRSRRACRLHSRHRARHLRRSTCRAIRRPSPRRGSSQSGAGTSSATATISSTAPSRVRPDSVTGASIYWGARIGSQFTGSSPPWSWQAVTDFENTNAGGKSLSLLEWGQYWYSTNWCGSGGYCTFPASQMSTVRSHGVIPFFNWEDRATNGAEIDTDAQIASGAQDSYITQWAQAAKAWGHPFFLRFDWEMNGNWFPWSPGANGNTTSSYVAMWRHVHDIFTKVGATNVSWVWCPNVDPNHIMTPLSALYPGDAYVDWTCVDLYNGDTPSWRSFSTLFTTTYQDITGTIAPAKPMILGEVASTESGGSKGQWITDMLNELPTTYPRVHGFVWFDMWMSGPGGHTDWPVESSAASETAFTQGIGHSSYGMSNYATLATSPIPPPS